MSRVEPVRYRIPFLVIFVVGVLPELSIGRGGHALLEVVNNSRSECIVPVIHRVHHDELVVGVEIGTVVGGVLHVPSIAHLARLSTHTNKKKLSTTHPHHGAGGLHAGGNLLQCTHGRSHHHHQLYHDPRTVRVDRHFPPDGLNIMPAICTAIAPGEPISVWCSIHESWDSDWTYVSERGDGRHYAKSDGIVYIVESSNILELVD